MLMTMTMRRDDSDMRMRLQGYGYAGEGTGEAAYSLEDEWFEGGAGSGLEAECDAPDSWRAF